MAMRCQRKGLLAVCLVLVISAGSGGCHTFHPDPCLCASEIPRELTKASLPPYMIEPPDILLINAVRVIPKPPYHMEPLDVIAVQVLNAPPNEPIGGLYAIDPDGTINLGFGYGTIPVAGLTITEARTIIEKHLSKILKEPKVEVALAQSRGQQQISGDHLVRPDGTVGLGTYGSVHVAGMTLPEAKAAIEAHLAASLLNPEVSVDVFSYNSKVYYVIMDGGGVGQQVVRLPVTGNETVLDAISNVAGLTPVSSNHRIWVARPGPACAPCDQVLPVDWLGIVAKGRTETNYQLLPGDRVYVQANPMVTTDNFLARAFQPISRVFGVTLLGNGTARAVGAPWPKTSAGGNSGAGGIGGFGGFGF